MKPLYPLSLFIFRRDLRLEDNTGLINALEQSSKVIPCFIFDPAQVGKDNSYRSMNAMQFMYESLEELNSQLHKKNSKLYCFHGDPHAVVKKLISQEKISAVFCNRDYTPFSLKRDEAIEHTCLRLGCLFNSSGDALLNEPEAVMKGDNTPYAIFTAFYNRAKKISVNNPRITSLNNFFSKAIDGAHDISSLHSQIVPKANRYIHCHGGSSIARATLSSLEKFADYIDDHDFPTKQTTNLSAHLKFGTVSVRTVYKAFVQTLGHDHPLIRQLYWRDFFTHIAYNSPFVFGHAYHEKYDNLVWNTDQKTFDAWCTGMTGFPIVDAGMRQLTTTGFMHNRARLIVASFLTKDLHIDWRWGEKFFAQHLIDYDPSVNNGNWQWAASTGCDAQPYFRIFNPWLQQKKFDPECTYIKQWVPELEHTDNKIIHTWFNAKHNSINKYPKPIVDHALESVRAKRMYKNVRF